MNKTIEDQTAQVISSGDLLSHWLGHRNLTRRVIEAFPDKEFFTFSIGGMRTFANMTVELLSIAGPAIKEIISGESAPFEEKFDHKHHKERILKKWDEETEYIRENWSDIPEKKFGETITLFGKYTDKTILSLFYIIDNEIHHRGQGYVYLRALGVEPPLFFER